jgi:hypothetical protein
LAELPIPAGTNKHDHSMFISLDDGSRLRIDRDFVDQCFQEMSDRGMKLYRNPTEMVRGLIGLGFYTAVEHGVIGRKEQVLMELQLVESNLQREQEFAQRMAALREQGLDEQADLFMSRWVD